ncbi:MAG: hypothetical protein HZC54_08335 [Verrucomicrobia bacterium]|nr:hypothetical protein [Verrucomicrobiota bacterium]
MKIRYQSMSLLGCLMACLTVLALTPAPVQAAHNLVTISVSEVTDMAIYGNVRIKNTTEAAQYGKLMLIVFEAEPEKEVKEVLRMDLGAVTLAAMLGDEVSVPFVVDLMLLGDLDKPLKLVADFKSAIGERAIPHSHCSTIKVMLTPEPHVME